MIYDALLARDKMLTYKEAHMYSPPSEKSRFKSFFGLDSGISSIHEYRSSKTCSSISTIVGFRLDKHFTERNISLFIVLYELT